MNEAVFCKRQLSAISNIFQQPALSSNIPWGAQSLASQLPTILCGGPQQPGPFSTRRDLQPLKTIQDRMRDKSVAIMKKNESHTDTAARQQQKSQGE